MSTTAVRRLALVQQAWIPINITVLVGIRVCVSVFVCVSVCVSVFVCVSVCVCASVCVLCVCFGERERERVMERKRE